MKRADAFMLAVTGFILANCISYFVRSGAPYVIGWGAPPWRGEPSEAIGFPFEVYGLTGGRLRLLWVNSLGNVAVAIVVGYLFSLRFARRLPPLWPDQSRAIHYSLRALLIGTTVACLLLGIAMTSPSMGLVVRNVVCLGGPVVGYAGLFDRRRVSWASLTAAALGLTLMTLAVDLGHRSPSIDDPPITVYRIIRAVLTSMDPTAWPDRIDGFAIYCAAHPIMRACVPVFGLLSFLVIASTAFSLVRGHCSRGQSNEGN